MRRYRRKKNSRKILIFSIVSIMFIMTAGYAAFSTNLNITAKGNVLEQDRVIQSWPYESNEDFHTDYYRENIVSATFLDNNNVPDNATESWNVSEDKEKGGVMAWVVPNNEDSTKYDLYIGANKGVIANENSSYLFYYFSSLTSIEFNNNFDTSNSIDMSCLFLNCTSLTTLDLSSFDTRNVTSMYAMFCMYDTDWLTNSLSTIIFGENFVTSSVTNMRSMFAGLTELQTLDVSNFDTSNVTTMFHMFMHCYSIKELDVSNFNTSKVTDMEFMFGLCRNLTNLDLCSFNTKSVTNMCGMFSGTPSITEIKVGSSWTTANAYTADMFTNSGVSSVTTGQCS